MLIWLFTGISYGMLIAGNFTSHIYKKVDTLSLSMQVILPESSTAKSPAMVFFFGGGWNQGSTQQFEPHAIHFARQGIACFLVEYRVKTRHQTTPFDALKDAKSAIRFIRKNAEEFGIDPARLIAAGGSAGGHLAAATALIEGYNDPSDDLSISSVPNALVLFNPVIDNGPAGYGYERISEAYLSFSPLHNIRKGAPPTIIFLGTKDRLIPVETMKYYQMAMQKVESRCDLFLYEGEDHGFFNHGRGKHYDITIQETEKFLMELGYL
ncbi:MAG: alpha/beta hydrolase [Cyclobacteriaceae bacterium]|nr:alpha/beta hydrolase [Cyclobacteriaceae bacterium]